MNKHQEIILDIRQKIATGLYPTGSRIPSVKKSAQDYDCAAETVVKAYRELVQQHVLYVKKNSGHYVGQLKTPNKTQQIHYNLTTGNVPVSKFPITESQTNLLSGIEKYGHQTLNYKLNGVPSLIAALEKYIHQLHLFVPAEEIYVCQGVHQSFVTICQYLLPPGKKILIENPTFSLAIDFLKHYHLPVETIERTQAGLSMTELAKIFHSGEIGLFFLTPRHHNPLGTTLPKQQIRKIAQLAEKADVFVVEDDYFATGLVDPAYETIFENTHTHCFYLSSFTKVVPYLRSGFMLIPPQQKENWSQIIHEYHLTNYFAPSLIAQSALEAMLRNGTLKHYQKILQKDLQEKHQQIRIAVKNWVPEIAQLVQVPSGYYGSILLPEKSVVSTLIKNLKQRSVSVTPLSPSFFEAHSPKAHGVRFSISQLAISEIQPAFQIIYEEACKLAQQ